MRLPEPPILLITDRAQMLRPFEEVASVVLEAGCRWISVREKDLDSAERLTLTRHVVDRASGYGATVTVHGDCEAAASAHGIHLSNAESVAGARRRLGSDALIGLSVHDPAELECAGQAGADYVTLSPIFASLSKPDYGPGPGLKGLRRAAETGSIPVIALGGVDAENTALCLEAGAHGVAVMGAVMAAQDPGHAMRRLVDCFV